MSADTDRLIAQARRSPLDGAEASLIASALDLGLQAWRQHDRPRERFTDALAALGRLRVALEAAEAQGAEESERLHRAEQGWADEARRAEAAEAQRDALAEAARAVVESHWFQIRSEGAAYALVQALAGVAPPEEQP